MVASLGEVNKRTSPELRLLQRSLTEVDVLRLAPLSVIKARMEAKAVEFCCYAGDRDGNIVRMLILTGIVWCALYIRFCLIGLSKYSRNLSLLDSDFYLSFELILDRSCRPAANRWQTCLT
jgi:hypothetical protein